MADFRGPPPETGDNATTARGDPEAPTTAWRTTTPTAPTAPRPPETAPETALRTAPGTEPATAAATAATARTAARVAPPPPHAAEAAAPPPARSPLGQLGRVIRGLLWIALGLALFVTCLVVAYRWITPPTSTLILGQRLTGTEISQIWRPLSAISPNLSRAVIMSEDAGFCRHRGVDWRELEAAFERGQDGGSSGGGSTISMQTTKNLFLWPSRSYVRKALEIPLTLLADAAWSKPRMLEFYLNIAEWGPGIFGAEAAARAYFNKPASALSEREAALLATALPNPLVRNPRTPSDLHRRLGANIETRMRAATSHTQCLTAIRRP